jgi:2',3'-cyclic-nucleotide 2'-phosphodiesterase
MTDVGTTGDYNSIVGLAISGPPHRFTTRVGMARFEAASGEATMCGISVETDDCTGLATREGPVRLGGCLKPAVPEP